MSEALEACRDDQEWSEVVMSGQEWSCDIFLTCRPGNKKVLNEKSVVNLQLNLMFSRHLICIVTPTSLW